MSLLSLAALPAMSQSAVLSNPGNHARWGIRASLDISVPGKINGAKVYHNDVGFSAGVVYQLPLVANLYFEPGLGIFYNTIGANQWTSFTEEVTNPSTGVVEDVEVPYQIDGSIRNFGFRIPLLIGYHFDFTEDIKVNVFTGPQLNLSLVSRYHQDEVKVPGYESPSSSTSLFGTNGFKHADLQWKFGVGISYQKYYLDLSGAWGMTKIMSTSEFAPRNIRRNLFSITLGYNF